jgi:S-adenosyl-L-methionine hydrolase (adenosine-forming)
MARPVVALLTDFGLSDHYVGAMKGVIAGLAPDATLIDITHELAAHDVRAGALSLEAAADAFPPGTIFLAVVDPGVGTVRRGIAARIGAWHVVGPDNGLWTLMARAHGVGEIVELTDARYHRQPVSRTFEGRDRFGPVAAWLARGTPLAAFGPPLDALHALDVPEAVLTGDTITGEILHVDRFGTLVTSVREPQLAEGGAVTPMVTIAAHAVPFVAAYADVAEGALCALVGSGGRLEIACNRGRACDVLQLDRGAPVVVRRSG